MKRPGVHAGHDGEHKSCQEPACVEHRARYHKRWAYERSHGKLRTTDALPARRHIETLIGAGWSYRAIAGSADLSPSTIHRVGRGWQDAITRSAESRILAVGGLPEAPAASSHEPFVPRIGSTRRMQALLFMGWTHRAMQEHCGISTAVTLNQEGRWVTRSKHDAIAAMYDELALTPGPSQRTRDRARRLGYVGPMSWDDIDHDPAPVADEVETGMRDPSAPVDEIAVQRFLDGDHKVPLNLLEKRELVRHWVAAGRSLNDLERLGWNPGRYIEREEGAA